MGKGAGWESYTQRNHYMMAHADYLLAVYDGEANLRSEVSQMVKYSRGKGISVIFIHPDTAVISYQP